MRSKRAFPKSEVVLQVPGVSGDIQSLVDAGCDRSAILAALESTFLLDESWEAEVKMSSRDLKRAIEEIGSCARLIDRLNQSALIHWLSIEIHDPDFIDVFQSPTLSARLLEYARRLNKQQEARGPKRRPRLHAWKALLVARVIFDTKRPHDREVSSIIAAALNEDAYTEDAHRTWRLKHKRLVASFIDKVSRSVR